MTSAAIAQASILAFPQRLASSNRHLSMSASAAGITDLRKESARSGIRASMLNMMLDAAILATRKPTEGADIAFDDASTNVIVSAIEGARRAVINALAIQRGDHE